MSNTAIQTHHALPQPGTLTTTCTCCRAQAIAVLLKDSARLDQERAAFANKRQVYKGFSKEQLSNGIVSRTHSADSMEGFSGATSSHNRQQVPPVSCLHVSQNHYHTYNLTPRNLQYDRHLPLALHASSFQHPSPDTGSLYGCCQSKSMCTCCGLYVCL